MPCAPMMTAVLMPITSPREDTSGPPELPGLSAASVWITSSISRPLRARNERPSAEMTPAVTVDSKPSGLPMATTSWPRRSFLESPSARMRQVARRTRAQQRQIGVGVVAERARLHDAAFGVEQPHFLGALDHVAIGQHQAVRRDDDAGADATRPLAPRVSTRSTAGPTRRRRMSRRANRRRGFRCRAPKSATTGCRPRAQDSM